MAGTGQGNKFLGDICRDTSCLMIRDLERRKFGIQMKSKVTSKQVLISAIAFVDDTDLLVEGDDGENTMNQMLGKHDELNAATGGYIEFDEIKYCAWQWKWSQGNKVLKDKKIKIALNNQETKAVDCKKSEKTLGVCVSPSFAWSKQFS